MTSVRSIFNLCCPNCDSDDRLQVAVTAMAGLSADGSEITGDQEWDDHSFIRCCACHRTDGLRAHKKRINAVFHAILCISPSRRNVCYALDVIEIPVGRNVTKLGFS